MDQRSFAVLMMAKAFDEHSEPVRLRISWRMTARDLSLIATQRAFAATIRAGGHPQAFSLRAQVCWLMKFQPTPSPSPRPPELLTRDIKVLQADMVRWNALFTY